MGITTHNVLYLCSRVGGCGRMEVLRGESDTDECREAKSSAFEFGVEFSHLKIQLCCKIYRLHEE